MDIFSIRFAIESLFEKVDGFTIVAAGLDATLGLIALWGYTIASKPMALLLVVLTWLVVGLAVVAVKCRAA